MPHQTQRPGGAPHGGGDPPGMEKIRFDKEDPGFVEHVRSALRAEAAESPVAAALLRRAARLPNNITVKRREFGLAETKTDKEGNITLLVNPRRMTPVTFSHELAHAIQQGAAYGVLQRACRAGRAPTEAEMDAAVEAGRNALRQVAPVKDEADECHEAKENEAMRVSNIVNAERTATQMRALPRARKTSAEFWRRQHARESAPRHQDNAQPMPPGSHYGGYDFQHVKRALGGG